MFDTSLSHLITNLILSKLEIETLYYGLIYEFIEKLINDNLIIDKINNFLIKYNLYYILLILSVLYSIQYIYNNYLKSSSKLIEYKTFDTHQIKIINKYLKNFPKYFSPIEKKQKGSGESKIQNQLTESNLKHSSNNENYPWFEYPITILDPTFKITGTITFYEYKKDIVVNSSENNSINTFITVPYIIIRTNKKNTIEDIDQYIKYMEKENTTIYDQKKEIELYHCPMFHNIQDNEQLIYDITTIYRGKKLDYETLKSQYIDSFFHPEKKKLWNKIYKVHNEPEFFNKKGQEPYIGILAHGPPGTGKSSFAYRIARTLNRHIVSIDLKAINTKSELWNKLTEIYIDNLHFKASEIVYVFDEFDYGIKYLYNNEQKKVQELRKLEKLNKLLNNKKKQNQDQNEDEDYSDNFINDRLVLTDLLNIFQGAVPISGLICIATTNDYKTIKKLCPALVRPGRLTPVYFGYPTNDILQEISQYYFNSQLSILPEKQINKPLSEIIDYALQLTIDDQTIKEFETYIQSL